MTKYVIGAISNLDTPRTPQLGNYILYAYITGTSQEDLQNKKEILGVIEI